MLTNEAILEMVKEITVARVSNSAPTKENLTEFMQAIYDKLTELNQKS